MSLPSWEPGTPGVLCVAGPHAIPVSTAVRAGADRLLLALGERRDTLRRLQADPQVAFCLLGEGVAFTAYGEARVVAERLASAPVAAVQLRVTSVADHLADGRTEMLDRARWRRTEERYAESDAAIAAELHGLAGG